MTEFAHTTGKVAAWNLAGFGPNGIPAERLELQVEGLALLDAEVVALVEVNPITAIETLRQGLSEMGVEYEASILPQQGSLNIGVLFKQGVTAENPRFIDGSDLGDPTRRRAFVVDMEMGRFDFTLIIVHLKSGRSAADQELRDAQARVIGGFIEDERNASREDILLVGDFNMIPGEDASNFHFLGGDDVMNFISSWDLQDRFSHILEVGRPNLLDGFAISRTFFTEYIRGSLRVFPMHWSMDIGLDRFRESVSDHLPFVASFKINSSRLD